jgi:hypothetical protein
MDGTATIEIAPTHPEFAAHHATKKNMHSSATLMSSQVFPTYPIQYMPAIPSQYCMVSRESLTPLSNLNNSSPSQLPVPNIKEFLEKVDKDEGSNGDYIQLIDAFNKQKISVKHIKDLNDEEFQILGVITIGWRKTIQAAAKQYE